VEHRGPFELFDLSRSTREMTQDLCARYPTGPMQAAAGGIKLRRVRMLEIFGKCGGNPPALAFRPDYMKVVQMPGDD